MDVPREHGFWVMLGAVVLAAVAEHPSLAALLAAILVVGGAAMLGSLVHRQVRRQPRLQLASALALATAAAVGFALAERRGHAVAALLGSAAALAFAIWRPGAKQMKPLGLTLVGVALLVALVLSVV